MALNILSEKWTEGTHIEFHTIGQSDSGLTLRIEVRKRGHHADVQGEVLGWVYWFPRWRKYIYHPSPGTIYEEVCMTEIAEFIAEKTDAHKNAPPMSAAVNQDVKLNAVDIERKES